MDTSSATAGRKPATVADSGTVTQKAAPCKGTSLSNSSNRCDEAKATIQGPSTDLFKTEAQTPLPLFPDLLQQASIAQAPHDTTLWSVIRAGFGLPKDISRPRVQAELAWYSKHAAYLERVTARAEPYLYYILQQLEKRHMPTELALLPVVESAFIPYAYSSSNAAGIWQFTPSTGLHFGLKQNWWYDGRRDIYASTNAALDYLQLLHNQFGSWLLALAAYNSGAGTVEAAIRYNQLRHRPTDFWSLNLPLETRHYVPKLLAVKAIVQNPRKYAVQLWPIPNKPYLAIVDLKSQIDMALAAKLAGIQLKELYLLNPGYNRWATDPDGPHRLLLPASRTAKFENALAKIPSSERVTWIRHRIRPGDTLSQIAFEYHTTVPIIQRTNHLYNNLIRVGHYLIVPRSSRPYGTYALAGGSPQSAPPPSQTGGRERTHIIRSGDTLWGLAQHYGVSVQNLARWNSLDTQAPLHPGSKLVIYALAGNRQRIANPLPQTGGQQQTHIIRSGDTLWGLAQRYGVSVQNLARWNGLNTHAPLHPGNKLVIRPRSLPTQYAANASFFAVPGRGQIRTVSYTVRQGDSLYSIARRFGVGIPEIRRWNDLGHSSLLHPGQPLKLRVDVTQQQSES